jgi:hypothetical protein
MWTSGVSGRWTAGKQHRQGKTFSRDIRHCHLPAWRESDQTALQIDNNILPDYLESRRQHRFEKLHCTQHPLLFLYVAVRTIWSS